MSVNIYSYNLMGYCRMMSVPMEYLVDADGKVFAQVDECDRGLYINAKRAYKDDIKLREFLESFKLIKKQCVKMKYLR